MPWANDGGDVWNATRCSPVADDAGAVGEPCEVEGSFVSGVDSCEGGAICTPLDEKSNEGVCTELCSGSLAAPVCDDTDDGTCILINDVLPLCGERCNPLTDTCTEGSACQARDDGWGCIPVGNADVGEPCDLPNACVEGAVCVGADSLCPEGEEGCCSQICDLSAPDPDAGCTEGRTCVGFCEPGTAPPGFDVVGLCWAE